MKEPQGNELIDVLKARFAKNMQQTPPAIRALGGALFCDRRYDQVFVYHNGAQSYHAARGFRGTLTV